MNKISIIIGAVLFSAWLFLIVTDLLHGSSVKVQNLQVTKDSIYHQLRYQDSILSVYARQIDSVKRENKYMHYLLHK